MKNLKKITILSLFTAFFAINAQAQISIQERPCPFNSSPYCIDYNNRHGRLSYQAIYSCKVEGSAYDTITITQNATFHDIILNLSTNGGNSIVTGSNSNPPKDLGDRIQYSGTIPSSGEMIVVIVNKLILNPVQSQLMFYTAEIASSPSATYNINCSKSE